VQVIYENIVNSFCVLTGVFQSLLLICLHLCYSVILYSSSSGTLLKISYWICAVKNAISESGFLFLFLCIIIIGKKLITVPVS